MKNQEASVPFLVFHVVVPLSGTLSVFAPWTFFLTLYFGLNFFEIVLRSVGSRERLALMTLPVISISGCVNVLGLTKLDSTCLQPGRAGSKK